MRAYSRMRYTHVYRTKIYKNIETSKENQRNRARLVWVALHAVAELRGYGWARPFSMLCERNEERDERAELARAMREEGKTLQQIADELGYKSVSSVHTLLNKG